MTRYQDIAQLLDANAITNVVDAYEKGRADVIEELKPYVLTNMDGEKFLWLKVDELNKLSFAEKLKEQNHE